MSLFFLFFSFFVPFSWQILLLLGFFIFHFILFFGGWGGNARLFERARRPTVFFLFFFLTTVLSHWNFSQEKFGSDRVALPRLRCVLGVLLFP